MFSNYQSVETALQTVTQLTTVTLRYRIFYICPVFWVKFVQLQHYKSINDPKKTMNNLKTAYTLGYWFHPNT